MAKAGTTTADEPAAITNNTIPDDMEPYILHDNAVWVPMRSGGFCGYVISRDIAKGTPWIAWEGGKISMSLWHTVMAFFEWSQKEFSAETQVRLYYHPVNRRWAAWAYPQKPVGMTTNEIGDHPEYATQRRQFPDPWINMGTIHHHCTSGAFQSGVDRTNEEAQNGLHITVGKITTPEYDLHNRVVIRGSQYTGHPWSQWFEMPEPVKMALPSKLHSKFLEEILKNPPGSDVVFPETWKTNCVRATPATTHTPYFNSGGASSTTNTRRWTPVDTNTRAQFKDAEIDFMEKAVAYMSKASVPHNAMDTMVNMTPEERLTESDRTHVKEIMGIAATHSIPEARVDELFDKWDFEVVLGELKKNAAASVK